MVDNNFSLKWLANPRIFAANRVNAHSDHSFYESLEEAKANTPMALKQSLNGCWSFCYAKNPQSAPQNFYESEFNVSAWDFIEVPGHIQMAGYDKCQYTNVIYPWDGVHDLIPPQISEDDNAVGCYVKTFTVDASLLSKKTYICFEGVEIAFALWINGKFVGYGEDSFTPSEFELTSYLVAGENKIAVEVFQRSSASWLEDQDFWRFFGIFRDVYLYGIPACHSMDIFAKPTLSDDFKIGTMTVEFQTLCEKACSASFTLENKSGDEVLKSETISVKEENTLIATLENPLLWSAEEPNLYTLYLSLYDDKNELIEVSVQKIGFRRFEIKDKIMYLNGKRIVFHGVNRHEFDCYRGRSIILEDMLWDIKFMKQNNINAVRTSHYPNHKDWYKLCDEYGIYLVDETNLESHGSWQQGFRDAFPVPHDNPDWQDAVLDRANSMLERDKNHASVLIWSCGNESYGGIDIFNMSELFRTKDPSRVVHYEGVSGVDYYDRRYPATSDVESRMYCHIPLIEEYLDSSPEKPFISCEYMHAMGNSLGNMDEYIALEDKYPMYQGGFIWDYIDQAIFKKDRFGHEILAYGGDFTDRYTDYNFCGNGIVYADRKPSPKMQDVKFLYQTVRIHPDKNGFEIENKNLFTDTSAYIFNYQLLKDGKSIYNSSLTCNVAAQDKKYVEVNLPECKEAGEYALQVSMVLAENTIWANRGFEVSFGETVWAQAGDKKVAPKGSMRIAHGDYNIGVWGDNFSVMFCRECHHSGIVSLVYGGKEYVATSATPQPIYYRASTDNDRGYGYPLQDAAWFGSDLFQKQVDYKFTEEKDKFTISFTYKPAVPVELTTSVTYTVTADGKIDVTLHYDGAESMPSLPLFGLGIQTFADYQNVTYYGLGPNENYRDRNRGARLGIYHKNVVDNLSEYLVPQECGNRTGVRWATVTDNFGRGLKFTAKDKPFEFGFLPYTAYELENAKHMNELPPVHYTNIRIMADQMGVGGDDSWMSPIHEQYLLDSKQPITYSFTIEAAI